jgi:hypothetical protein
MSLSDSHSDRPACRRCERSDDGALRDVAIVQAGGSGPLVFGEAFYPNHAKGIIEECNHLNRRS